MMNAPQDIQLNIARRAKARRLSLNLSQKTLSERSGVSYGTLKKFEQTGLISLKSLLSLSVTLNALDDFEKLFINKQQYPETMDELLKQKTRQRGRQ
jgi:transcriptional regulator with XRE-family HTH domain